MTISILNKPIPPNEFLNSPYEEEFSSYLSLEEFNENIISFKNNFFKKHKYHIEDNKIHVMSCNGYESDTYIKLYVDIKVKNPNYENQLIDYHRNLEKYNKLLKHLEHE